MPSVAGPSLPSSYPAAVRHSTATPRQTPAPSVQATAPTTSTDQYGNSIGTNVEGPGSAAINMFQNPAAVFHQVRAPILGIDTKNPGQGPISGLPYWNVDLSLTKSVRIAEGVAFEFSFISTNVFNHLDFQSPSDMALYDTTGWGVVNAQGNTPRQMQFGGRIRF